VATLWLIGMMGSGKTAVAPLVAARLDLPWYDTDREIEARSGRSLAALITEDEPGFRALERAEVARLAGRDAVVACGGGVVLDDATVTLMRETGRVIHLDASPVTLAARLGKGEGRPLLAEGVEAALLRIDRERAERYAAAAHAVVDAEDVEETVAERVVDAWNLSS